jgi:hypothetical protein
MVLNAHKERMLLQFHNLHALLGRIGADESKYHAPSNEFTVRRSISQSISRSGTTPNSQINQSPACTERRYPPEFGATLDLRHKAGIDFVTMAVTLFDIRSTIFIDTHIFGTTRNPRIDVLGRIFMQAIQGSSAAITSL